MSDAKRRRLSVGRWQPGHRAAVSYDAWDAHQLDLRAHHSCVNALALSNDGRYLASGGDDLRVLLHDVDALADGPKGASGGAQSNIFSIAWTCDDRLIDQSILHAGNDGLVLRIDVETALSGRAPSTSAPAVYGSSRLTRDRVVALAGPLDCLAESNGAVKRVAAHPTNPHELLSASDDGVIRLYDLRVSPSQMVAAMDNDRMFNDVAYSPTTPLLFATAARGEVLLHDMRKSLVSGVDNEELPRDLAVKRYACKLGRRDSTAKRSRALASPSVSSVSFDPTGRMLAAELSGHFPTIWAIDDERPLVSLRADDYADRCTTKHGGWGTFGSDRLFYASGSDTFRCFLYELPSMEDLKQRSREPMEVEAWIASGPDELAMATHHRGLRYYPAELSPVDSVGRFRSIINSAVCHPRLPLLFTSGVESVVRVHSPIALPETSGATAPASGPPDTLASVDDETVRRVARHRTVRGDTPSAHDWTDELLAREEDDETLELFAMLAVESRSRSLHFQSEDDDSAEETDEEDDFIGVWGEDGLSPPLPLGVSMGE